MDTNQFIDNLQYWQNISQFLLNYNQQDPSNPSNYNHIISINQMSQILTAELPETNIIFTPEPQPQLQPSPQPQPLPQPQPQPLPLPQPQVLQKPSCLWMGGVRFIHLFIILIPRFQI